MERALFICNTPYQIMVAFQIKDKICNGDVADIIITDHMNEGKRVADNIRKCSVFNEVYYIQVKNKFENFGYLTKILYSISGKLKNKYLSKFIEINNSYSTIYISNLNAIVPYIYHKVFNNNTMNNLNKPKIYVFEDGLSTYSPLFEKYINSNMILKTNSILENIKIKIRSHATYKNLAGLYLFNPELIQWKTTIPTFKIPNIDIIDNITKEYLNNIFDYQNCIDSYDTKVIFFEESYYAEGFTVNDLEVVEHLANKYGKDNIMIKIHPRNPINRFEKLGYKTNSDTFVPWELIALNENIEEKVLVTISSSSLINTYLILGKNANYTFLFKCINVDKYMDKDIKSTINNICDYYCDIYDTLDKLEDISKI